MYVRNRLTTEIQTQDQFERYVRNLGVVVVPGMITPQFMDLYGFDPVQEGPQPTGEGWQHAQLDGAELINGTWRTKYRLEPTEYSPEVHAQQQEIWLATLAAKRWEIASGAFTYGPLTIKLDGTTTDNLDAAYMFATRNSEFTADWSINNRTFITLDAPTIIALGDAVGAHVQACFSNQKVLASEILAANDYDELTAVDLQSGWPTT